MTSPAGGRPITLIVSANDGWLVTVSDVLLSVAGVREIELVGLPVSPGRQVLTFGTLTISGFAQKAVLLDDRHLLLWAGHQMVAEYVAGELSAKLQSGWDGDLFECVDTLSLTTNELSEVSLVYHRISGTTPMLFRDGHNIKQSSIAGQDVLHRGTGEFHFLDDIVPTFEQNSGQDDLDFLHPWLSRVSFAFLDESSQFETLYYAYGGWFEVAFLTENRIKKMPYAIKLWRLDDDQLIDLPYFSSWYVDNHLCIATVVHPCNSGGTVYIKLVRDPLNRTNPPDLSTIGETFVAPTFQLHIVTNREGRAIALPMETRYSGFSLAIDGAGVSSRLAPDFAAQIAKAFSEGVTGHVSRPFSRPG